MEKRIEMIFETTRVQHTLYVLRSGPAAGGALGLLLMLLVAAAGHQMKPATFDFITESLLFLSLSLGWPKGSLARSHPDVGRGG